ncbi:MAG TPA: OPT/YSL family transporter [Steroidobacteraceae bacterium]
MNAEPLEQPAHSGVAASVPRWQWLPAVNSWKYHLLIGAIGILVLGPLGGVTASYMNFSLGFYVGGQVLAGILGSTVTYGYGAEGKHGANYIQTAAASVAGMSAMAVVIQAMVWMGMPQPPTLYLILYMLCIGMYGAGVGMLYTPILVDRLNLVYPSGLAVANILRALTDPELLKRSVAMLGGGMLTGLAGGLGAGKLAWLGATGLSMSTIGAGMVVGARVGVPALIGGLVAKALVPYFVSIGWLLPGEPFRKITFLIALGMILGASIIDMSLILWGVVQRARTMREENVPQEVEPWKKTQLSRLVVWVLCWGVGVVWVGTQLLSQPAGYIILALLLVFVFALVNGISQGLTDWNPISSAFVVTVLIMATLGLKDAMVGLIAGTAMLIAISVGSDMQQDRSTGRRLGTSRTNQFRYQIAGVAVGAISAVAFAKLFMAAYPVLLQDQTVMSAAQQPAQWTSAMTYKFVGTLRSLTDVKPYQRTAILVGIALGFATELLRKLIAANRRYRVYLQAGKGARIVDFTVFALILPSPYASSFGGFVNLPTAAWFAGGSLLAESYEGITKGRGPVRAQGLPSDMSVTSLVGGGLIAGDAIAALGIGIYGLLSALAGT